jgi:predicted nucleotidyltransferase
MDKEKIIALAKIFAAKVNELMSVKRVILFGSYARGNPGPYSDIDLAVVVDDLKEDFLDTEIKLYRLRRDLDDRIEPVLLIENKDRSGFLEEIEKYGIPVFGS